jgi:UDPglucose 6-dehydrogenase/GDP-mannose 6-dehydrogenase
MKISIIGAGYAGLVTGACLAEKGHCIVCVDVDQSKVDAINEGRSPIYEAGLDELIQKNLHKQLRATTDLRQAVLDTEVSIIAVGTPFNGQQIDLSYVKDAAREIGAALRRKTSYHLVVVKSTVVPGTLEEVVLPALEEASGKKAGVDFGVGMNPEFLSEGQAVRDFMSPDRIVLGALDAKSLSQLEQIFSVFDGVPKIRTNLRTAETIKYAANSFFATMISFANEIGNLCAAIGDVDAVEVLKGVQLARELSPAPALNRFLEVGCGFGGSCFPKDVKAFATFGNKLGVPMRLLEAVIEINGAQPQHVLALLHHHFPDLHGVRIAVLGLAFKPGTDDIRESPAIPILEALVRSQAEIRAHDPAAIPACQKLFPTGVSYRSELSDTIENAQVILVLTRWPEFAELPALLRGRARQPLVIDGRRMLDKQSVQLYEGVGLGANGT